MGSNSSLIDECTKSENGQHERMEEVKYEDLWYERGVSPTIIDARYRCRQCGNDIPYEDPELTGEPIMGPGTF